ncbi:MAG: sulfate transporter ATP-binding protein [Rhodospirillales bacterium]|jgi:sulfate transport system ATP-binding protein|nr:sulfate transporter ATP-binding protein [Rhodospirillales bacterium]
MGVDIAGMSKRFGRAEILSGIELSIARGEFVALLGPSGSGKTTLLRIIAGLEAASAGSLRIDDRDALSLPPRERKIGFVFQNYALFRHLRVFDNVAFGLQVKKRAERPPREVIARRVAELLELVQLGGLGQRFPSQLSGGQRQRVALARALAVDPELLLLDEPFGALDAGVRVALRQWLRGLHDSLGLTSIFVTHDQEEALALADRIALLNRGRIEQVGTPADLYDHPGTAFVMGFLGAVNRLDCAVSGGGVRLAGDTQPLDAQQISGPLPANGPAIALVRPHDLRLLGPAERGGSRVLLRSIAVVGARLRLILEKSGHTIEAEADRDRVDASWLHPGSQLRIEFSRVRIFATDGSAGEAIAPSESDQARPLSRHPARAALR